MRKVLLFILCLFILPGCSDDLFQKSEKEDEIIVSAATSLTDVMKELREAYKDVDPSTELTFNFGSSGKLAQQIQQGAQADIFLSADQTRMDMLDEQELIASGTRTNFATNELVLIASKDHHFTMNALDELPSLGVQKIAIGNPDNVPAGTYAKQALQQKEIWDPTLEDTFVYGEDVHQVLTDVKSGKANVGFVFSSAITHADNVEIILRIDAGLHEDIVYPAGVTSYSLNNKKARDFISFLKSDEALSIFRSFGFN